MDKNRMDLLCRIRDNLTNPEVVVSDEELMKIDIKQLFLSHSANYRVKGKCHKLSTCKVEQTLMTKCQPM